MSALSEKEWGPQACLEPRVLVKGKKSALGGKEGAGKSVVGLGVKGTGPPGWGGEEPVKQECFREILSAEGHDLSTMTLQTPSKHQTCLLMFSWCMLSVSSLPVKAMEEDDV